MNNIFQYEYFQNSIFAALIIGLVLPIVGLIMLLRRKPYIAEAMGHISMSGVVFFFFLNSIFANFFGSSYLVIIIYSALGGILIEYLSTKYVYYKDVSIMIVYSIATASTIIFLDLTSGFRDNLFNILFGNINTISKADLGVLLVASIVILLVFYFDYKKIVVLSIDEEYSKIYKVNYNFQRYLSIVLISIAITLSIKVIGVLLVSSLVLIPNLAAMRIAKNLKSSLVIAIIITEFSMIFGIIIAYLLNVSSSAIIVFLTIIIYVLTLTDKSSKSKG